MRNTLFLFALTLPLIGLGQTSSDTLSRFLEPAAVTAVRATERAPGTCHGPRTRGRA